MAMPGRRIFASWHEVALLAICAAILAAQLLAPPFIGLADNGDFAKVAGRLSLGAEGGPANFIYFIPDYLRSPRHYWKSETLSTELPLAWLATRLAGATKEGDVFDIRWLGALHGILLLCAVYALIRRLRPLPRGRAILIAAVAVWIFTDVSYVAYFNSFYTDAAALLGLLLMIPLAVDIAAAGLRNGNAILFCLAALLFIGSKPQHAIWGFLPAGWIALADRRRALLAAFTLLALSGIALRLRPQDYSAAPLFNLVFAKLTLHGPTPKEFLRELGLPEEDSAFIGMNAFMPGAPVLDPAWLARFEQQTSYRAVLKWYLQHPLRTLEILNQTLVVEGFQIRARNVSNFRRQDGFPPSARTDRFASWSDFRSAMFLKWPHHILVWYLLVIIGSIRMVRTRRTPVRTRLGWIVLGIATLAIGEFCVASLADAEETYRHLFVFHACTDLTICFAIAAALTALPAKSIRGQPIFSR